jgi:hypothetical protein
LVSHAGCVPIDLFTIQYVQSGRQTACLNIKKPRPYRIPSIAPRQSISETYPTLIFIGAGFAPFSSQGGMNRARRDVLDGSFFT